MDRSLLANGKRLSYTSFRRHPAAVSAAFALCAFIVAGCGSPGKGTGSSSGNVDSGGGGTQTQPVAIARQPASQTVPIGQTATFTVVATGTGPFIYQWSENGAPIAGATGASYTTSVIALSDSGSTYKVTVSNSAGSVDSNTATLTAGPRSPKSGDLRFQQVDAPSVANLETAGGTVSDLIVHVTMWYANSIGSPLELGYGICYPGIQFDCAWAYFTVNLPVAEAGSLKLYYTSGEFSQYESDLQAIAASNRVMTSLDFQPADNAYAAEILQTFVTTGFDYREEIVTPAQAQTTATQDGAESRVITAVSFDAQGKVHLFSYGWQSDTATVYETQTILAATDDVVAAATSLAGDGYILTAFGGDDTNGYELIGTRVKGDTMPRPIIIATIQSPAKEGSLNGYAPVARPRNTLIYEK